MNTIAEVGKGGRLATQSGSAVSIKGKARFLSLVAEKINDVRVSLVNRLFRLHQAGFEIASSLPLITIMKITMSTDSDAENDAIKAQRLEFLAEISEGEATEVLRESGGAMDAALLPMLFEEGTAGDGVNEAEQDLTEDAKREKPSDDKKEPPSQTKADATGVDAAVQCQKNEAALTEPGTHAIEGKPKSICNKFGMEADIPLALWEGGEDAEVVELHRGTGDMKSSKPTKPRRPMEDVDDESLALKPDVGIEQGTLTQTR